METLKSDNTRMQLFNQFTYKLMGKLGKGYVSSQIIPHNESLYDTFLIDRRGKITGYRHVANVHQTDKFRLNGTPFLGTRIVLESNPSVSILIQLYSEGIVPMFYIPSVVSSIEKAAATYRERMKEVGYDDYNIALWSDKKVSII